MSESTREKLRAFVLEKTESAIADLTDHLDDVVHGLVSRECL